MKILLDTCTFLWIITDAPELSNSARESFVDPANEVYLSAVSTWEIVIKYALGKLSLPESPERYIPFQRQQHNINTLPLEEGATLYFGRLPLLHKDPFDHILICQAIMHGMVIMTSDELVVQYPVRTIW